MKLTGGKWYLVLASPPHTVTYGPYTSLCEAKGARKAADFKAIELLILYAPQSVAWPEEGE